MADKQIKQALKNIKLPDPNSHKGQNGKLLIIGGSELFHAASKWSLDIASKFVDMLFYSSVPSNNELIKEAKQNFWNGIVVPRNEVEKYIGEADCVLIGPGMERSEETGEVVNKLLKKRSDRKWVVDAGALQMVGPTLLKPHHIITPHIKEMELLNSKVKDKSIDATVLLKGPTDTIIHNDKQIEIRGGNAGMTKGGTGDVLAGLVAALYCTHDELTACIVASHINKKAGEQLHETVGPYFNASDLTTMVPEILWQELDR